MVALLAACSSEFTASEDAATCPADQEGYTFFMPNMEFEDAPIMRSALYYPGTGSDMQFTWHKNDNIGVFPFSTKKPDYTVDGTKEGSQQYFTLTNIETSEEGSTGYFTPGENGFMAVEDLTTYVSYIPYNASHVLGYDKVAFDYSHQNQACNAKMGRYYAGTNQNKDAYKTSEIAAAAHLTSANYMVAKAETNRQNSIHFDFAYMGATVRFFIMVPDATVKYETLQLYNKDHKFKMSGTMNVGTGEFNSDDLKESNIIDLKLGNENGFTFKTEAEKADYWYGNYYAMMIAYMELAPVNLDTPSTLYLVGKNSNNETVVFKSETLAPKNIEAGKVYQWKIADEVIDQPITFSAISIEKWKEETEGPNNGEGTGTEGW